jgi:hypothetical protein
MGNEGEYVVYILYPYMNPVEIVLRREEEGD